MTLRQFALQRDAQILDFFVVDKQIGVARDAELIAAVDVHARKQFADMGVQDGRQENEAIVDPAQLLWQSYHAWQCARGLNNGRAGTTAEGIGTFQFDCKIQTLVEYARKGMRRIQSDRGQHRHHFDHKKLADPFLLCFSPQAAANKLDAFSGQRGKDDIVKQGILLRDQFVRLVSDAAKDFLRQDPICRGSMAAKFELFLDSRGTNLEELIQIGRYDAKKTQSFQ